MSFKYKPKIVLKNLNYQGIFEKFNSYLQDKDLHVYFQNSITEDRNCQLCSKLIPLEEQIYGIPICIRQLEKELEIDMYGTYCSLQCSYQNYKNIKENTTTRKNIKFLDSEQLFRCLFYKLCKKYTIEFVDRHINLKDKSIKIKKINSIL